MFRLQPGRVDLYIYFVYFFFIFPPAALLCPVCLPLQRRFLICNVKLWHGSTYRPHLHFFRQILNVRHNKLNSNGFKILLIMQTVFVPLRSDPSY